MDTAFRTPWVEMFRRGDVDIEVRLQAAQGLLAPRPSEQLALLVSLCADADEQVATVAHATLDSIPEARLAAVLARPDVPADLRAFFEQRGVQPAAVPDTDEEQPLLAGSDVPPALEIESAAADGGAEEVDPDASSGVFQQLALMTVPQRLSMAMKGPREARGILIRDPNKLISLAVLSSPKITETEVESFARMTSVTEEVLRTISTTRAWMKSYTICVALVKNPKTPLAISMNLLARLNDRDLRGVSTDRNVPEVLRNTARRKVATEKR